MTKTFLVLGVYFGIAVVPKLPWYVKVILQLVLGVVIYFGFPEAMFDLPAGDKLPISSLFGGSPEWAGEGFNKYSMGFLGTVLGLVATAVATGAYAVFGTKKPKE